MHRELGDPARLWGGRAAHPGSARGLRAGARSARRWIPPAASRVRSVGQLWMCSDPRRRRRSVAPGAPFGFGPRINAPRQVGWRAVHCGPRGERAARRDPRLAPGGEEKPRPARSGARSRGVLLSCDACDAQSTACSRSGGEPTPPQPPRLPSPPPPAPPRRCVGQGSEAEWRVGV